VSEINFLICIYYTKNERVCQEPKRPFFQNWGRIAHPKRQFTHVGCDHGCVYCYATFIKHFTGHKEEWGEFVDVKVNAAEVLARQMRRAKWGNIAFDTVTDPYQPPEKKCQITRACLEVLTAYDFADGRPFWKAGEGRRLLIIVDSMKLSGAIWGRVRGVLERHSLDLVEGYRHIATNRQPYHEALMARARLLAGKHGLAWGG